MSRDTVAYQGVPGAFSEQAARDFVENAELLACPRFEDLFDAVTTGRARWGAVPIENTLAGSVHACYDLLARHAVTVTAEAVLRISHALIAPRRVEVRDVRRVLSHPMALLQCERFFQENPGIEAVAVHDTAAAAQEVVSGGRPDTAALASLRAAEVYGGVVLAENLEDDPMNFTRFLLITRPEERAADGHSGPRPLKTSLIFQVENRPAALFEALRPFAVRGINLTKIESRPVRGSRFEYLFYVDAAVPPERKQDLDGAVEALAHCSMDLRRLGTYPAAETAAPL